MGRAGAVRGGSGARGAVGGRAFARRFRSAVSAHLPPPGPVMPAPRSSPFRPGGRGLGYFATQAWNRFSRLSPCSSQNSTFVRSALSRWPWAVGRLGSILGEMLLPVPLAVQP